MRLSRISRYEKNQVHVDIFFFAKMVIKLNPFVFTPQLTNWCGSDSSDVTAARLRWCLQVASNQTVAVSYISRPFITSLQCEERLRIHDTAAKMEVTAENCQTRQEQKAVTTFVTAESYWGWTQRLRMHHLQSSKGLFLVSICWNLLSLILGSSHEAETIPNRRADN